MELSVIYICLYWRLMGRDRYGQQEAGHDGHNTSVFGFRKTHFRGSFFSSVSSSNRSVSSRKKLEQTRRGTAGAGSHLARAMKFLIYSFSSISFAHGYHSCREWPRLVCSTYSTAIRTVAASKGNAEKQFVNKQFTRLLGLYYGSFG